MLRSCLLSNSIQLFQRSRKCEQLKMDGRWTMRDDNSALEASPFVLCKGARKTEIMQIYVKFHSIRLK